MTTTDTIQTLTLTLSHHIKPHQISRWRGAFLEMINSDNELFHNHKNEGKAASTNRDSKSFHYRYPLIQYFEKDGVGKILAINKGCEALLDTLGEVDKELKINWNNRPLELKILDISHGSHTFQMLPQLKKYRLNKWLALNTKNYQRWLQADNLEQRVQLLNKLLANHIIALFKELNYDWTSRLEAELLMLHQATPISYKGMELYAFDVEFATNAELPIGLAIGNKVSHGYGWIESTDKNDNRRPSILR